MSAASIAERTNALYQDAQPLCALIPWLFGADDLVVLKNGALLACFAVDGIDIDSTTTAEMNSVRAQVIYALEQLQEKGVTMWWTMRRREFKKYRSTSMPEPMSQAISDAYIDNLAHQKLYQNAAAFAVEFPPPDESQKLMSKIERGAEGGSVLAGIKQALTDFLFARADFPYADPQDLQAHADQVRASIAQLTSSLSAIGIRQLLDEDLTAHLCSSVSPTRSFKKLAMPALDDFWDTTLAYDAIGNEHADTLVFEGNGGEQLYAASYTLRLDKRNRLALDMLDSLLKTAELEFTLSHVYRFLPSGKGVSSAKAMARYHGNRKLSPAAWIALLITKDASGIKVNEERAESEALASAVASAVETGKAGVGFWYGCIVVQSRSLAGLKHDCSRLETLLEGLRLLPLRETMHKLSTWTATVPGCQSEIVAWKLITTENYADLLPIRTVKIGSTFNEWLSQELRTPCHALMPLMTHFKSPYYYTGYVGDVGHTLILGPTGAGKTTWALLELTMYRQYPGARGIVFDKNFSSRPAVLLQGGTYINLNPEQVQQGAHRMGPIAALLKDGSLEHAAFVKQWLKLAAKTAGHTLTTADEEELENAIRATAELGREAPHLLSLSTIVTKLNMLGGLGSALKTYTQGQILGHYFDNAEDNIHFDSLTAIENGTILENEQIAPLYMSYVFYRIASELRRTAGVYAIAPTFIYLPEVWYFVKSPAFRDELCEWLVTLRKLGARIVMDTQSPEQLMQSGFYAAIRDNVATIVFAANPMAQSVSLSRTYMSEFMLTPEQVSFIANGIKKRDYLIRQGEECQRVSMHLPPDVMNRLNSSKVAQVLIDELYGKPDWIDEYLAALAAHKNFDPEEAQS